MGISNWRPRHTDPLFLLAMDHRGSFGKTVFGVVDDKPTDDQRSAMESAKTLIYQGLRRASSQLPVGRAGVLVDEEYGSRVISQAATDPVVLAIPVEASGREWFGLAWGEEWLDHVRAISPAYAKVLVRDNPDFDADSRYRQLEALVGVSGALAQAGIPLLYELLVPATDGQLASVGKDATRFDAELRPALTVAVLADNQAAGVEPVLWKIEGLETVEAASDIAAQARTAGRTADLIVLGRDAPVDRLDHWLSVAAQVEEFVGFAIGRSIWQEPVQAWYAGTAGNDDSVERIARRYLDFVAQWH